MDAWPSEPPRLRFKEGSPLLLLQPVPLALCAGSAAAWPGSEKGAARPGSAAVCRPPAPATPARTLRKLCSSTACSAAQAPAIAAPPDLEEEDRRFSNLRQLPECEHVVITPQRSPRSVTRVLAVILPSLPWDYIHTKAFQRRALPPPTSLDVVGGVGFPGCPDAGLLGWPDGCLHGA